MDTKQKVWVLLFCILSIGVGARKKGTLKLRQILPSQKVLKGRVPLQENMDAPSSFLEESGFDYSPEEMRKLKIWPKGIIPYYIDKVSYDKPLRDQIRVELDGVSDLTALRFVELTEPPRDYDKTRWVMFINRAVLLDCDDHVISKFSDNGVQRVVLGYDCLATGAAVKKAVLALAGIPPQHNSPDRDSVITVNIANIESGKQDFFTKLKDTDWLFHDIPYDLKSVGHYGVFKYSAIGAPTIVPKSQVTYNVGEANTFSDSDIRKIQMLYNYISRKSEYSNCKSIFKPGSNYSRYPQTENRDRKLKPRPKPYKYTGGSKQDNIPGDEEENAEEGGSIGEGEIGPDEDEEITEGGEGGGGTEGEGVDEGEEGGEGEGGDEGAVGDEGEGGDEGGEGTEIGEDNEGGGTEGGGMEGGGAEGEGSIIETEEENPGEERLRSRNNKKRGRKGKRKLNKKPNKKRKLRKRKKNLRDNKENEVIQRTSKTSAARKFDDNIYF